MKQIVNVILLGILVLQALCGQCMAGKAIGIEGLPKSNFNVVSETALGESAGLFVGINEFNEDDGLAELNFAVNDAIEQAHVFVRELKLIPAKTVFSVCPAHQVQILLGKSLNYLKKMGWRFYRQKSPAFYGLYV